MNGTVRFDKFLTKELPKRYGVHPLTVKKWIKRLFPVLVERGVLKVENKLVYKFWKVTDKEKFVKVFSEEVEKWKEKK